MDAAPCMRRPARQQLAGERSFCASIPAPSRKYTRGKGGAAAPARRARSLVVARGKGDDEEPDWDKEMSIFKQRMMRPNQLATLREMEAKVSVGRVLWCQEGLAILTGVNSDAPLGTKLAFVSGGSGVLLWHRSDNLAFALVLGGASTIRPGQGVECKIKGVLQVIDETRGPITRKEYELWQAPAGESLFGRVADYLGRPLDGGGGGGGVTFAAPATAEVVASFDEEVAAATAAEGEEAGAAPSGGGGGAAAPASGASSSSSSSGAGGSAVGVGGELVALLGQERYKPLINQQVAMKNREQICESLLTGVKALDTLTPLGRGASLLVIGPRGSGKSDLALDAVLGQVVGAPVARGSSGSSGSGSGSSSGGTASGGVRCVYASVTQTEEQLSSKITALRAGGAAANTALLAAAPGAPLGERMATLCAAAALGERVRDEGGHALVVLDDLGPMLGSWERLVLALAELGQDKLREGLIKDQEGRDIKLSPQTEQELVDYEGMLVSGAAAQRRGFFSTLFLRAAKMARAFGGGTMTLLPLVPGRPATGIKTAANVDLSKYQTLSEEQKAKIKAALEARATEAAAARAAMAPGELSTEAVEEFISISDGQVVLLPPDSSASASSSSADLAVYRVNPKLSVTRIGSRAYYKALETLAPQVRLELAQGEDARKFSANPNDPVVKKLEAYTQRLEAALQQQRRQPASLEEQVVALYCIQHGYADAVPPEQAAAFVERAVDWCRQVAPRALREVAATKQLTAAAEKGIADALEALAASKKGVTTPAVRP